jgi:hypothetical protein
MKWGVTVRRAVALVVAVLVGGLSLAIVPIAPTPAPADTTTTGTGLSAVRDMRVDPTTGRIYLTGDNELRVFEPDGGFVASVTGLFGASAIDVIGSDVWVAQSNAGKVSKISTVSSAITETYTLGTTVTDTIAVVGNSIWFTGATDCCSHAHVWRYAIGSGVLTDVGDFYNPAVARIPGDDTRVLVYERGISNGPVHKVNTSTAAVAASVSTGRYLSEFTVSGDGSKFWTSGVGDSPEFSVSTLTTSGIEYPGPVASASSGLGGVLAGRVLLTNKVWVGRVGLPAASHIIPGLEPSRVALAIDGSRLFTITDDNTLRIDTLAPTITNAPSTAVAGVPTELTVQGTGLGATTGATLGGVTASYSDVTPSQVRVLVPVGVAAGVRPLVISSPFGNLSVPVTMQANAGATLSGTVTAASAPVPGIELTLAGGALGADEEVTTDVDGSYEFAAAPYGTTYVLSVHDPGDNFADQTLRGITLTPNDTTTRNIDLLTPPAPVAAPSASVDVPAPAEVRDVEADPATGRVFVSNGDELDVFDQNGVLEKRFQGFWGVQGIAISGGAVYVNNRTAAQIVRINTSTLAITGTWPLNVDTNGEIAFAGGRVWFIHGNDQWTSIASLNPANGAIVTTIPTIYNPGLAQVVGDANKFLAYERGILNAATIAYTVSGGTATAFSSASSVFGPVLANGPTQHLWTSAGLEYSLNPLAPDGLIYPGSGPLSYASSHGGLVQFGTTIMQEGTPLRTHHLPTTSVANALDAAGGRTYVATENGQLETWDLKPQVLEIDPSPVPTTSGAVTVTGQGYGITTGVTIDNNPVPFFSALSTEQLSMTVPALSPGVHQLRVSNLWGTSSAFAFDVADLAVPSAPLAVTATPGGLSAQVSWTSPVNNGGSPITNYTATAEPGGATCSSIVPSCTIDGLEAGTPYTVTVVATNDVGSGPASAPSDEVVPTEVTVPSAPTDVLAVAGPQQVALSWSPPADTGGAAITGYVITPYVAAVAQVPIDVGPAPFAFVLDLDAGTAYTFTVAAKNVAGTSDPSELSNEATPTSAMLPSSPTNVIATPASGQVNVQWSAASSGGSPITGYTVTAEPGGRVCNTGGQLSCTVTQLANGTNYSFTVVAKTVVGNSPPSAPSSVVTPVAAGGAPFHPLTPTRILDSRPATKIGPYSTRWQGGETRPVTVAPIAGVPTDATAVALNVTVTDTSGAGSHLTVWPAGTTQPVASNLNWLPGTAIANAVTVKVGDGGVMNVFNNAGNANVVIDVVGYYDTDPGDGFTALTPTRVVDSRPATQVGPFATPWGATTTRTVQVAGTAGVPADATAVVVNATATGTTAGSFLTLWPSGQSRPLASNLNWSPGQTIANAVTAKVGANGSIDVYNNLGNADVVLDIVGYFTTGTGTKFHPLDPKRVLDSRPPTKVGNFSSPWATQSARLLALAGSSGVPSGALSALCNVTVTNTTGTSFLTVWPNLADQPLASTLNWTPGQTIPNSATARLGPNRDVWIYNDLGSADVVLDVSGWYG